MGKFWGLLLAVPALVCGADQPARLRGPVLGYVFNRVDSTLRPVLGLPGASLQGDAVDLGAEVKDAAVAPGQSAALAVLGTAELVAFELPADGPAVRHDLGATAAEDARFSFSPNGRAAAIWSAHRIQIVTGLPSAPKLTADIAFEAPEAVALSDGGSLIAAREENGGATLYRVDEPPAALWTGGRISGLAFLPGQDDALVADSGAREIWEVRSVSGSPAAVRLATAADGITDPVAVAAASGKAYAANSSGAITQIDLRGGGTATVSCSCTPSSLDRMSGSGVFRLTGPGTGTIWLLDIAGGDARVLFVPNRQAPVQRHAERPAPGSGRRK